MTINPFKEPIRIGAEIFIEPGQTPEEIDNWFRIMRGHAMTVTRIRMFESYMHFEGAEKDSSVQPGNTGGDTWDFSLFDQAFKAGEKYGIAIYANLFPATDFSDVGGFKFPKSQENLEAIANYIKRLVGHFTQYSSLYGWVPINEPGSGDLPADEFTRMKSDEWKMNRQELAYNSNGFHTFEFVEQRFLLDYNTWFLEWLCKQIRQYDPVRPIHVNNHDIFKHAAEYNFPAWRHFLSSLGGSAHASWHFGYFGREQYAVAMSANAEILRSGAGNIPWLMTELQGGNNTYSGRVPMCPTKEEIVQWIWINIGAQSRGAIFWCLNPRRSGFEAGEWALLDFLDNPSDRMLAAADVSQVLENHRDLFDQAEVAEPLISVVYTRESMWIEKALQTEGTGYDGRRPGGTMKSSLAYFEVLSEMGIHAGFSELREYNFNKNDYRNKAIILAHQISIPSDYWTKLDTFVALGGTLIVEGLSAYYDENAHCILGAKFPFNAIFGASVKEFKMVSELFDVQLNDPSLLLKGHLWKGLLQAGTAEPIAVAGEETIGCRNYYKEGKTVWLPMLLGLGARISGDYLPLAQLLYYELQSIIKLHPIYFKAHTSAMMLKILRNDNFYVSIIVNKSSVKREVDLSLHNLTDPQLLFCNKNGCLKEQGVIIEPEETIVIQWKST